MAAHTDFASGGGVEAENGGSHFAAAGADEPSQAEDFAGAQLEADVRKLAGRGEVFDVEKLFAERAIEVGGAGVGDFASDHLGDDAFGGGLGNGFGGDMAAVAEDADGVAEAEDFFQPMGNVDDGDAASF